MRFTITLGGKDMVGEVYEVSDPIISIIVPGTDHGMDGEITIQTYIRQDTGERMLEVVDSGGGQLLDIPL